MIKRLVPHFVTFTALLFVSTARAQPTGPTAQGDNMSPGQVLHRDNAIKSPSGLYMLTLQQDGNLVLYRAGGRALWASNTVNRPVFVCIMQADGNLVLYDVHGHALWASNTWKIPGSAGGHLSMQDDGNLVLYTSTGRAIWATNTQQPGPPGESVSLIARTWTKKWNSNPLAGGCKSDYVVGFEVPQGTKLYAVGLTTNRTCGDHPFNTNIGGEAGSAVGGARLLVRPPNESGPGLYQAKVHWWFNQWFDTETSLCVWVHGKSSQPLETDQARSDDMSKATPHPVPFCVGGAYIAGSASCDTQGCDGAELTDISADDFHWTSKEHPCFVMWPGCAK